MINPAHQPDDSPRDSLGELLSLQVGRIQAFVAGPNFYHVMCRRGMVRAVPTSDAGARIMGTRGGGQFMPGTWVVMAGQFRTDGQEQIAYIMGAIRMPSVNRSLVPADLDVAIPTAGWLWDRVHNYLPLTTPESMGLMNANDGTPMDSLAGEWGKYGPMGPAIHVGHFMSYLRASDRTGLWLFTMDELARLAARSVQIHTRSQQYEDQQDEQGEVMVIDHRAFLPWEADGAADADIPTAEASEQPQDDPRSPPTKAAISPIHEDQVGIFRDTTLRGFLAGIEQRFISLPDLESGEVRRLSTAEEDAKKLAGLYHHHLRADGHLSLRSAKGLTFEKYCALPVPLQRYELADPNGDNAEDVEFNKTEQPVEDYKFAEEETPVDRLPLGLELHGWATQQAGKPFRERKDWENPTEKDTKFGQELTSATTPEYKLDAKRMWMALPRYTEQTIQKNRWEGVRYYASRSVLDFLDDGSVMLECGYGAGLLFSGGNVFITAPNDVVLAPGRNLVTLAGNDLVLRANRDMDLTTSRGDLRLKAERNLQALAANSGEGAMVFDCRAVEDNLVSDPGTDSDYRGMVFRADACPISALSKQLYLQTNDDGQLLLRAGGSLSLYGRQAVIGTEDGLDLLTGRGAADSQAPANELWACRFAPNEILLGSTRTFGLIYMNTGAASASEPSGLRLEGGFTWSGQGVWDAQIRADLSLQFTGSISSRNTEISQLTTLQDQQLQTETREIGPTSTDIRQQAVEDIEQLQEQQLELLAADDRLSNRDVLRSAVHFSLRTELNMGLQNDDGWAIPQWRWQQYAKDQGELWEEPVVVYPPAMEQQFTPWPGYRLWSEASAHLCQGAGKFFVDGFAVDAEGSTSPIERRVLAASYRVNT